MNKQTSMEVPFAGSYELISEILNYQDLDSLLRLSAMIANKALDGDGCSLFFFQPESNELLLKESTTLTPHFPGGQVFTRTEKTTRISELMKQHEARMRELRVDPCGTLTWKTAVDIDPDLARCA